MLAVLIRLSNQNISYRLGLYLKDHGLGMGVQNYFNYLHRKIVALIAFLKFKKTTKSIHENPLDFSVCGRRPTPEHRAP